MKQTPYLSIDPFFRPRAPRRWPEPGRRGQYSYIATHGRKEKMAPFCGARCAKGTLRASWTSPVRM